jgi:hypothetical protein
MSSVIPGSYPFLFLLKQKFRIFYIGDYTMKDTAIMLNNLEADVAELQALVMNLECQEKELRDIITKLDTVQTVPGTETPKKVILAPETNR